MHELYQLKEMLCKELEEYGRKGEVTANTLEIVDKLAHAVKNLGKIIEMYEEEEEYSMDGGNAYRESMRGYARRGNSSRGGNRGGNRGGSSNRRGSSYDGGSRNYYSREGRTDMMVEQLEDLMEDAPDERTRQEIQRLVTKMQSMN